jgi:hypothetical protein
MEKKTTKKIPTTKRKAVPVKKAPARKIVTKSTAKKPVRKVTPKKTTARKISTGKKQSMLPKRKTVANKLGGTKLPIGQTLETNDLFLPYKKTRVPQSKSRPVIIIDKNKLEEYAIVPGSTKKTPNTTEYNKYGIKHFRHDIEVEDNEGKPIKQNNKFKQTEKTTKLPISDVNKIKDELLNHKKFSSENRRKYQCFKNRHKKSKD